MTSKVYTEKVRKARDLYKQGLISKNVLKEVFAEFLSEYLLKKKEVQNDM